MHEFVPVWQDMDASMNYAKIQNASPLSAQACSLPDEPELLTPAHHPIMFQFGAQKWGREPYDRLISFDYRLAITIVRIPSAYPFQWNHINEGHANLQCRPILTRSLELTTFFIQITFTQCLEAYWHE